MAEYISAHQFSANNRKQLEQSSICGCFYCGKIFNPNKITEWIPEKSGTALCPYCGIDSVIGESTGYPITQEFMEAMRRYWFGK